MIAVSSGLFGVLVCYFGRATDALSFATLPRARLQRGTSLAAASSKSNQAFLKYPLTQVVSDIDDTLKSSGGVTIAGVALGGIDVQYARGEFYPGVFQFMWELSLYSVKLNQRYYDDHFQGDDSASLPMLTPPKVAVLTAVSGMLRLRVDQHSDY